MTTRALEDLTAHPPPLRRVFTRTLKAQNKSDATIAAYSSAVRQFADYLKAQGMPTSEARIN